MSFVKVKDDLSEAGTGSTQKHNRVVSAARQMWECKKGLRGQPGMWRAEISFLTVLAAALCCHAVLD